jgi:hypothetical protein
MPTLRKRPCRFCRRWFSPEPQQRGRQYACSEAECQAKRQAANQADWLKEHPGYFRGRAEEHRAYRGEHPDADRRRREDPARREDERGRRAERRRRAPLRRAAEQEARNLQVAVAPGLPTALARAAEQEALNAQALILVALATRLGPAAEQEPIAGALSALHAWGQRLLGAGRHRA